MRRLVFLVTFLLTALVAGLAAQTPDTATLAGRITDSNHAAISGVAVTLANAQLNLTRTASTDAAGKYSIGGLPVAGQWVLSATKDGFAAIKPQELTLIGGAGATVDLTLAAAGATSTIQVTGTEGEVRADEPELGVVLDAKQLAETPLFNNQITYAALLNSANRPSINMGDVFMNENLITTNGTGRRETQYQTDGANNDNSWGRQTVLTNVPVDAVQEMSVLENGFSAEYGFTGGGVVNIVTKSGGQQWHGDLDYAVRPNGMEAALAGFNQNGFTSGFGTGTVGGNDQISDEFNQGAWSLSGPVGEKTQFYIAGEDNFRDRASPVTSPVAPQNYVGHYRDGLMFTRVDHQFSNRNTAFARADVDSFYDTNPNGIVGGNSLPTVARIFSRRTYEGEFGDNYVISPNLLNSLRLEYQLADPITEFVPVDNSTAYSVTIASLASTFTTGTSTSAKLINHQYELNDTLATNWGRHSVKFGGGAIFGHDGGNSKEFGGPNYLGTFTFGTCPTSDTVLYCETNWIQTYGNVSNFQQAFGQANYSVNDNLYSTFLQDDFHFSQKLTLNFGLRYERQTFTDSTKDFAPRAGFDYELMPGTILRGGYGIYYSQIVDNSEANYALSGPTGVFTFSANPGQPGFPTTITPYSSLAALEAAGGEPACGLVSPTTTCLIRTSVYLRPGMANYYNQFFPTSVLEGYQNGLLNPYTQQWSLGLEHHFAGNWDLSADYVGSHTLRIQRPLDLDAPPPFVRTGQDQWRGVTNLGVTAAGYPQQQCTATGAITTDDTYAGGTVNGATIKAGTTTADTTCAANAANAARPLWIYDAAHGLPNQYQQILSDVNDGVAWYDALEVNLSHRFSNHFQMLASYTWSHTMDTVDMDATAQSPNDAANVYESTEKGNALWNQPQRFVLSGRYSAPFGIILGGVNTMASGLQFNPTTGTTNGGNSGGETDRPVINGVVVARNSGRGSPYYSLDPFVERPFHISDRINLDLRAQSFNLLNHGNFAGYNTTFGNATAPAAFATNSFGVTSQFIAREFQFNARLSF